MLACAAILGACTNEPLPREVEEFDGPAPIRFGIDPSFMKSAPINSIDGVSFHVFSKDTTSNLGYRSQYLLYNAPARGQGISLKLRATQSDADSTYLYPRGNDDDFVFWATNADMEAASGENNGVYTVDIGQKDILWGKSAAPTPLSDPNDASQTWNTYNFDYAIRASIWYPDNYAFLPKITLKHILSQLEFRFVAENAAAEAALAQKISLAGVCVDKPYRKAVLNVWNGSLSSPSSQDTLIVSGSPVAPTVEGAPFGSVYVYPGETDLKFTYTLSFFNENTNQTTNWTIPTAIPLPSSISFEKGHQYILKITIKNIDNIQLFFEDNYIDADAATFAEGLTFSWEEMGNDNSNTEIPGTIDYE